jgi:hypothetical protein
VENTSEIIPRSWHPAFEKTGDPQVQADEAKPQDKAFRNARAWINQRVAIPFLLHWPGSIPSFLVVHGRLYLMLTLMFMFSLYFSD